MTRATVVVGMLMLFLGAGCGGRVASREAGNVLAVEEVPLLRNAEELGREIYACDQYAARATDLLLDHGLDLAGAGTMGWITESCQDGCAVTYVAGDPQQWRSLCVVTFTEYEEPNIILVDRDLTEAQSAMFSARQLALDNVERSCSDAYNTVVLPREGEPGWLAYALAATSDPNLILVGGHYRATVSADGRTLLDWRSFARDCTVLRRPQGTGPDVEIVACTLGHVLDDRPTEVHVFLNLFYGRPLYVVTADRRFWLVEDGKIHLLKRN